MATLVILDIDDTLVDHSTAERIASEQFGVRFCSAIPAYDPDTFVDRWHKIAMRHFNDFLALRTSLAEQRRRRIREVFSDSSMSNAAADARFSEYLHLYEDAWRLFSDVPQFLNERDGLRLAALSDGGQQQQEYKLKRLGIRSHFEFVLTAEAARMAKPEPEFYRLACSRAGMEPADTYYIGDNLEKDAIGPSRAGLNGVWLNRNKRLSDVTVPTIRRLTDFRIT